MTDAAESDEVSRNDLVKIFEKNLLTNVSTLMYYIRGYRNGGEDVSPKGRPTDNPKTLSTRIRLSEEDVQRLEYCAEKTGMTKSEIIRLGIKEVYEKLKK